VTARQALTDLAYELGFADQAHMTRTVRAITGQPPRAWRAQVK
jgi:AraC-like DNA-binding protein